MKSNSIQHKLIFYFILFSILILGIYILATASTRADINSLSKQKEILAEEKQKLEELVSGEKALLEQSDEIKVELTDLKKSFPTESKEEQFIKEIKKLLAKSKINLKKLAPEVSLVESKKYQSLSYSLELRGEYQKYLSFLAKLNNLDRLISINQILLKDDSELLLIEMLVTIYYKEDDKDV